jgi:hypothetical protein
VSSGRWKRSGEGANEGEGWLPERTSAFICRRGLVLWCACVDDHWAAWAAERSGIVRRFYGLGGRVGGARVGSDDGRFQSSWV